MTYVDMTFACQYNPEQSNGYAIFLRYITKRFHLSEDKISFCLIIHIFNINKMMSTLREVNIKARRKDKEKRTNATLRRSHFTKRTSVPRSCVVNRKKVVGFFVDEFQDAREFRHFVSSSVPM